MPSVLTGKPAPLCRFDIAPRGAHDDVSSVIERCRDPPDASLEVTETIDVRAERNAINHGVFRDFPTRYRGPHGTQVRVGFTFEGATLDGQPVETSTSTVFNGVRIKIGDPDTFVEIGEHRYVIRYRTTRQLGRFKDYDELYWNATGNGWMFPIDVAEARIRLPRPVKFGQRAVYTGPQGSIQHFAEVVEEKTGGNRVSHNPAARTKRGSYRSRRLSQGRGRRRR